ncbi:MAG: nuclear transport factor 2 family protein [Verrucomicrobium sp.]
MGTFLKRLCHLSTGAANSSVLILLAIVSLVGVGCKSATPPAYPQEAEVKTFLNRYFSTWSAKDMEGYGSCFHPQARVFFLTEGQGVVSQGLTDFLHGQRMAHEQAATPMTERPVDMRIQGDERGAQACVTWVLTKGAKEERGTDLFTLQKEASGWKIISLAFYGE